MKKDHQKDNARYQTYIYYSMATSLVLLMGSSCADKKKSETSKSEEIRIDQDALGAFERSVVKINASEQKCEATLSSKSDPDLNSVLNTCGVEDLSDKEKVIFSSQMDYTYTRKIHAGIAVAYVPITSTLNLTGTLGTTILDVGVKVGSVRGESVLGPVTDLKPIEEQAENLARKFRGKAISHMKGPGVIRLSQWDGLICNIAALKIVNERSGYYTEAEITPAFLPNVSPLLTRERLEREIEQFRVFGPLSVKIIKTDNPALKGLTEVKGNIIVERVDPKQRKGQKIEGAKAEIEGDSAFRITNNFMSDEVTLALGFHLWTEYYIDHKQKAFSAVVANVGDDDIMYFIGSYVGDKGGDTIVDVPRYDPEIKNLINASCIECHHKNQKATPLHLEDVAQVKAAGSKIRDMVKSGQMPKQQKLKDEQIKMVDRWAENGYQ